MKNIKKFLFILLIALLVGVFNVYANEENETNIIEDTTINETVIEEEDNNDATENTNQENAVVLKTSDAPDGVEETDPISGGTYTVTIKVTPDGAGYLIDDKHTIDDLVTSIVFRDLDATDLNPYKYFPFVYAYGNPGYRFKGWYKGDTCITSESYHISRGDIGWYLNFTTSSDGSKVYQDTVFEARFEFIGFTVTYKDGADGEVFTDDVHDKLPYESKTPDYSGGIPERDGYKFVGWWVEYYNEDDTALQRFFVGADILEYFDVVYRDMTFIAGWVPIITINVQKFWVGIEGDESVPDIKIRLVCINPYDEDITEDDLEEGENIEDYYEIIKVIELKCSEGEYELSFDGVEQYGEYGTPWEYAYKYIVEEVDVPAGFISEVTGDAENGFIITNTYTLVQTAIQITKKVEGLEDYDGEPVTYKFTVTGTDENGNFVEKEAEITMSGEEKSVTTMVTLPAGEYTVLEECENESQIKGYSMTTVYSYTEIIVATGKMREVTITNTYTPAHDPDPDDLEEPDPDPEIPTPTEEDENLGEGGDEVIEVEIEPNVLLSKPPKTGARENIISIIGLLSIISISGLFIIKKELN